MLKRISEETLQIIKNNINFINIELPINDDSFLVLFD